MARQRKVKSDGPRWRAFMDEARSRIIKRVGAFGGTADIYLKIIAVEIVAHGDAPAFLKSVRRGRPTQRQNIRYQLLREVERLAGDGVKRRRPDSNTPDAQALKKNVTLELELYAAAGRMK